MTWHRWDETEEGVWVHTQTIIQASGWPLTVFLKGYDLFAAQGGATLFDDLLVVDSGLQS